MRLIIKIHRILGTMFSILFLMWFLTGIVMIYHHYPSLSGNDALGYRCEESGRAMLPLDSIISNVSLSVDSIKEMQVTIMSGTTLLNVKRGSEELLYDCHSGQKVARLLRPALDKVAHSWCDASVVDVDSLDEIDVWLIGAYPFKEYPVYKYTFDDEDKTELYLSSRTGRGLQLTTSESRFWSWVGAIPHWIYIKQLRATGRQPWTDVVLWISGFGILMTLSGIIVGIRSMVLARRQRKLCPYKKPMFRWHHLSGLVFGLFVLAFIFSGFMSLQKVPTSLVPYNEDYTAESFFCGQEFIDPSRYKYDYRKLLKDSDVRRITLTSCAGMPVFKVEKADGCVLVCAEGDEADTLVIDDGICREMANRALAHGIGYSVSVINDYEQGYSSVRKSRKRELPVYRVAINDEYNSRFYVAPKAATAYYSNNNSVMRGILYNTLHSLNCRFFYEHPVLREVILWLLMLGGTVVSLTGVVLGVRYLWRKTEKLTISS